MFSVILCGLCVGNATPFEVVKSEKIPDFARILGITVGVDYFRELEASIGEGKARMINQLRMGREWVFGSTKIQSNASGQVGNDRVVQWMTIEGWNGELGSTAPFSYAGSGVIGKLKAGMSMQECLDAVPGIRINYHERGRLDQEHQVRIRSSNGEWTTFHFYLKLTVDRNGLSKIHISGMPGIDP